MYKCKCMRESLAISYIQFQVFVWGFINCLVAVFMENSTSVPIFQLSHPSQLWGWGLKKNIIHYLNRLHFNQNDGIRFMICP